MKKPKVCILRTAGTNCDKETYLAFELAGGNPELVHINQFINNKNTLDNYQILAVPGGFTYGDDVSAGKILANELKYKIFDQLNRFAEGSGKLIIGICNGFQVLVKAGLLAEGATLTNNDSGKFECRWVYLKSGNGNKNSAINKIWLKGLPEVIQLPVAHAEGKFVTQNKKVLNILRNNVAFRYCNPGKKTVEYPWNPNGSEDNITGVCNKEGNILGMMPHPERYVFKHQHPYWTNLKKKSKYGDGFLLFKNAVEWCC